MKQKQKNASSRFSSTKRIATVSNGASRQIIIQRDQSVDVFYTPDYQPRYLSLNAPLFFFSSFFLFSQLLSSSSFEFSRQGIRAIRFISFGCSQCQLAIFFGNLCDGLISASDSLSFSHSETFAIKTFALDARARFAPQLCHPPRFNSLYAHTGFNRHHSALYTSLTLALACMCSQLRPKMSQFFLSFLTPSYLTVFFPPTAPSMMSIFLVSHEQLFEKLGIRFFFFS